MDLIKKLFSFNDDETSIIGLCQFNDDFIKSINNKETMQAKIEKNQSISELLKRSN